MPHAFEGEISSNNVKLFDPNSVLTDGQSLDPAIGGGLKKYLKSLACLRGKLSVETAADLIRGVADYEDELPLFSTQPFRYAALPFLPEAGVRRTAELTARSAVENMDYMQERFGAEAFAAETYASRQVRLIEWDAPIDDDYHLHVRGASGAGTFSIDLGLGVMDRSKEPPKYKELWRAGIDTAHAYGILGARFIRTGSGIKQEHDDFKVKAFDRFRKRHGILPQRLLGLLGLYFMRELEPDYAVALTTTGARRLSTLGRSQGCCDYSGIFANIGFQPSTDEDWLAITDFGEGFYEALMRAGIRRREEPVLDTAMRSLNAMEPIDPDQRDRGRLFEVCTDEGRDVIERELRVALALRRGHRFLPFRGR